MISNFNDAKDFLFNSIPKTHNGKFPGIDGLNRTKKFLELLGNPQEKVKVIHIAGTSGKGSTAYIISHILTNLGFKTGLTLSPHLIDIRERCQINNKLIPYQYNTSTIFLNNYYYVRFNKS